MTEPGVWAVGYLLYTTIPKAVSGAPGRYTPYSLFSRVASPIRRGLWGEFSSWRISILDGNRLPHRGQSCALSTPARVDLRVDRLPDSNGLAVVTRQLLRQIRMTSLALILPGLSWIALHRYLNIAPSEVMTQGVSPARMALDGTTVLEVIRPLAI